MARRKDPDTYYLNDHNEPVRCPYKYHSKWLWQQARAHREGAHSLKDRSVVGLDSVGEIMVKTVFTGVDARTVKNTYGIEPGTGPLLFVTISYIPMVVGQTIHRRYSTFDEAVDGHFEVLAEVQASMEQQTDMETE